MTEEEAAADTAPVPPAAASLSSKRDIGGGKTTTPTTVVSPFSPTERSERVVGGARGQEGTAAAPESMSSCSCSSSSSRSSSASSSPAVLVPGTLPVVQEPVAVVAAGLSPRIPRSSSSLVNLLSSSKSLSSLSLELLDTPENAVFVTFAAQRGEFTARSSVGVGAMGSANSSAAGSSSWMASGPRTIGRGALGAGDRGTVPSPAVSGPGIGLPWWHPSPRGGGPVLGARRHSSDGPVLGGGGGGGGGGSGAESEKVCPGGPLPGDLLTVRIPVTEEMGESLTFLVEESLSQLKEYGLMPKHPVAFVFNGRRLIDSTAVETWPTTSPPPGQQLQEQSLLGCGLTPFCTLEAQLLRDRNSSEKVDAEEQSLCPAAPPDGSNSPVDPEEDYSFRIWVEGHFPDHCQMQCRRLSLWTSSNTRWETVVSQAHDILNLPANHYCINSPFRPEHTLQMCNIGANTVLRCAPRPCIEVELPFGKRTMTVMSVVETCKLEDVKIRAEKETGIRHTCLELYLNDDKLLQDNSHLLIQLGYRPGDKLSLHVIATPALDRRSLQRHRNLIEVEEDTESPACSKRRTRKETRDVSAESPMLSPAQPGEDLQGLSDLPLISEDDEINAWAQSFSGKRSILRGVTPSDVLSKVKTMIWVEMNIKEDAQQLELSIRDGEEERRESLFNVSDSCTLESIGVRSSAHLVYTFHLVLRSPLEKNGAPLDSGKLLSILPTSPPFVNRPLSPDVPPPFSKASKGSPFLKINVRKKNGVQSQESSSKASGMVELVDLKADVPREVEEADQDEEDTVLVDDGGEDDVIFDEDEDEDEEAEGEGEVGEKRVECVGSEEQGRTEESRSSKVLQGRSMSQSSGGSGRGSSGILSGKGISGGGSLLKQAGVSSPPLAASSNAAGGTAVAAVGSGGLFTNLSNPPSGIVRRNSPHPNAPRAAGLSVAPRPSSSTVAQHRQGRTMPAVPEPSSGATIRRPVSSHVAIVDSNGEVHKLAVETPLLLGPEVPCSPQVQDQPFSFPPFLDPSTSDCSIQEEESLGTSSSPLVEDVEASILDSDSPIPTSSRVAAPKDPATGSAQPPPLPAPPPPQVMRRNSGLSLQVGKGNRIHVSQGGEDSDEDEESDEDEDEEDEYAPPPTPSGGRRSSQPTLDLDEARLLPPDWRNATSQSLRRSLSAGSVPVQDMNLAWKGSSDGDPPPLPVHLSPERVRHMLRGFVGQKEPAGLRSQIVVESDRSKSVSFAERKPRPSFQLELTPASPVGEDADATKGEAKASPSSTKAGSQHVPPPSSSSGSIGTGAMAARSRRQRHQRGSMLMGNQDWKASLGGISEGDGGGAENEDAEQDDEDDVTPAREEGLMLSFQKRPAAGSPPDDDPVSKREVGRRGEGLLTRRRSQAELALESLSSDRGNPRVAKMWPDLLHDELNPSERLLFRPSDNIRFWFQNYSNQQYVVPSVIDLENVIQVCDVDRGVSVEGHCEMEPQDMCLSFIPKNPWRLGGTFKISFRRGCVHNAGGCTNDLQFQADVRTEPSPEDDHLKTVSCFFTVATEYPVSLRAFVGLYGCQDECAVPVFLQRNTEDVLWELRRNLASTMCLQATSIVNIRVWRGHWQKVECDRDVWRLQQADLLTVDVLFLEEISVKMWFQSHGLVEYFPLVFEKLRPSKLLDLADMFDEILDLLPESHSQKFCRYVGELLGDFE